MSPRSLEVGPLEMEVLGIFEGGSPLSVTDVQAALKQAGKPLAYTTVMTVLTRLHGKGLLNRTKEGRQFLYSKAKAAGKLSEGVLSRIGRTLFKNEGLKPILALIDRDRGLSREELLELKRVVDQKLKSTGKE